MNLLVLCIATILARSCVLANPGDNCETDDITDDLLRLSLRLRIEGIVPDMLPSPPETVLGVKFETVAVDSGNCLRPTLTVREPVFEFPDVDNGTFTVGMFDVDTPSRVAAVLRYGILGLFLNVKGVQGEPFVPSSGFQLAPYVPPAPVSCSGGHRMVFVVYRQKEDINTDSRNLINVSIRRIQFDLAQFVSNYTLGNPIAANYFISDHCCSIDCNNCCNTNEVCCNND